MDNSFPFCTVQSKKPEGQFIRIPEGMLGPGKYEKISLGAKILYCILADRCSLSMRNAKETGNYIDEAGRVFIKYSIKSAAKMLGATKNTVKKYMEELLINSLIRTDPEFGAAKNQTYNIYVADYNILMREDQELTPRGSKIDCQKMTPNKINVILNKTEVTNPVVDQKTGYPFEERFQDLVGQYLQEAYDTVVSEKSSVVGQYNIHGQYLSADDLRQIFCGLDRKDLDIIYAEASAASIPKTTDSRNRYLISMITRIADPKTRGRIRENNYTAPVNMDKTLAARQPKKNGFSDFKQRSYDFAELEKEAYE